MQSIDILHEEHIASDKPGWNGEVMLKSRRESCSRSVKSRTWRSSRGLCNLPLGEATLRVYFGNNRTEQYKLFHLRL
jgi:hypothetical protein